MIERVKEKLESEMKEKTPGSHAAAVRPAVHAQLLAFAEQNEEFAQAILDSTGTLNDCCKACVEGCGSSISDLKVYRRMAAFYFPGATVEMSLTINLSGEAEKSPLSSYKKKAVVLDLFSVL